MSWLIHTGNDGNCPATYESPAGSPIPTTSSRGTTSESHVIVGMLMPIFERKLRNSGFIELAEALRDHSVVLFLGRARER